MGVCHTVLNDSLADPEAVHDIALLARKLINVTASGMLWVRRLNGKTLLVD